MKRVIVKGLTCFTVFILTAIGFFGCFFLVNFGPMFINNWFFK